MVDQKIENESSSQVVENALAMLWEKAREASYLISTLRDEKTKLQTRIHELEDELVQVKSELREMRSHAEAREGALTNGAGTSSVLLAEDDKRELQRRIKAIIGKLDQYLST
jgi:predicted  nucleic acid-binding Zn-ribbon protein